MKLVVDTNIIFSALLNSNSAIGDLLFNSDRYFEFYSCSYMRHEIKKHWERLQKISKLSEGQLQVSYTQVLLKLRFIDEAIIPVETWLAAEALTKGIDIDDTDFVALTKFLKATLWTGDKYFTRGLKRLILKDCSTHLNYLHFGLLKTRNRTVCGIGLLTPLAKPVPPSNKLKTATASDRP